MGITVVTNSETQETSETTQAETSAENNEQSLAQETEQGEQAEVTEASDETEGDGEKTEAKTEDDKPKKKSGVQRLKEKLSAKDQELEYWKQQALRGAGEPKKETPKLETASTDKAPEEGDFETYGEYVRATARWEARQELKAEAAKTREHEVKTQHQRAEAAFIERVESFIEKHDDWDDVMEEIDDIPIPMALQAEFRTAEDGPRLMYDLAKNRAELERIAKLPAHMIPRAIGRFEASLEKKATTTEAKTTKAPAPLNPVKAGGTGSAKKSIYDADLSFAEYERLRAPKEARRA